MECPHCQRPTSPHAERCSACGGVIPPGQHMLEESGVVEPAVNLLDPYPGQEENTELYRMASLGDRFIAFALDTIFLFGVFAILDAWALMRIVDGFGFYLLGAVVAGCSRFRRRLGDICARTVVVEEEFGYAVKILAVVLWAGVLAGAMWSVPRICARNPAKQVRYLDQVVVEVGRTEKSAYFKVAGLRIDVQSASRGAP